MLFEIDSFVKMFIYGPLSRDQSHPVPADIVASKVPSFPRPSRVEDLMIFPPPHAACWQPGSYVLCLTRHRFDPFFLPPLFSNAREPPSFSTV